MFCNIIFSACIVGLVEIAPNFFQLETLSIYGDRIETYYAIGPVPDFSQDFSRDLEIK